MTPTIPMVTATSTQIRLPAARRVAKAPMPKTKQAFETGLRHRAMSRVMGPNE